MSEEKLEEEPQELRDVKLEESLQCSSLPPLPIATIADDIGLWSVTAIFRLPGGELTPSTSPQERFRIAMAHSPSEAQESLEALIPSLEQNSNRERLADTIRTLVDRDIQRTWCHILLKDCSYARVVAAAFGPDTAGVLAGFIFPPRPWRVILLDAMQKYPLGGLRKRQRDDALLMCSQEVVMPKNVRRFSGMCPGSSAIQDFLPGNFEIDRARKVVNRNRIGYATYNKKSKT